MLTTTIEEVGVFPLGFIRMAMITTMMAMSTTTVVAARVCAPADNTLRQNRTIISSQRQLLQSSTALHKTALLKPNVFCYCTTAPYNTMQCNKIDRSSKFMPGGECNATQLKANASGGVLQIVYVADRRAATTGHYKSIRLRWGVVASNLRLNEGNLGSDRIPRRR